MLERIGHPFLMLFVSMAIGATLNALVNAYSKKHIKNLADSAVYTIRLSVIAAMIVLFFILGDGFAGISPFTVAMSAIFAAVSFANTLVHLRALSLGPLALTSIFTAASSVIPALYGLIFMGESFTLWQVAGILLMLVSVFFSVEKGGQEKKASLKWLAWALLDFLLVGAFGVCQKIHHASPYAAEMNEYLLLTFCFVILYACITLLILRVKGVRPTVHRESKGKIAALTLSIGITHGMVNMLNLFLSGQFDGALFYPVVNGGTVMTTILLSFIVFRERFSKRRVVSIAFGILSLCFLLGVIEGLLRLCGVNL